jgi:hypothetical protein
VRENMALGQYIDSHHEAGHIASVAYCGLWFNGAYVGEDGGGWVNYDSVEGDLDPHDGAVVSLAGYVGQSLALGIVPTVDGYLEDSNCSGDRDCMREYLGDETDEYLTTRAQKEIDHLYQLMVDDQDIISALAVELSRRGYISHQTLIALLEAEKAGLDMAGIPNHIDKKNAY